MSMSVQDVFSGDPFTMRAMTDSINKAPFVPGLLGRMGLFRASGIEVQTAQIEERDGVLYLVPSQPHGAPPLQNRRAQRKMTPINTVHLPVEDRIHASELQGVRQFGTADAFETLQDKTNEVIGSIRQSLEATHEWHRIGAIKGIQYDADGTTVLNNFFTIFGITAPDVVHFNFGTDVTSADGGVLRKLSNGIIRDIEDALGATPYDHVHAIVGKDFMDGMVDNVETHEAYKRWNEGESLRGSYVRRTFPYAGIVYEEYRGSVGTQKFVEDNEARFFPVGAPDVFRAYFSPAEFFSEINQPGKPFYAKVVPDNADRWADILAESNPLFLCTRPRVLRRGLTAS